MIDRFAPDVNLPFRLISPGSVLTLLVWLAFSLILSLYAGNFGSYNATYGSFAGFAIFLLNMYYSAYVVLIGAEINQVILQHKQGGQSREEQQEHRAQHESRSRHRKPG